MHRVSARCSQTQGDLFGPTPSIALPRWAAPPSAPIAASSPPPDPDDRPGAAIAAHRAGPSRRPATLRNFCRPQRQADPPQRLCKYPLPCHKMQMGQSCARPERCIFNALRRAGCHPVRQPEYFGRVRCRVKYRGGRGFAMFEFEFVAALYSIYFRAFRSHVAIIFMSDTATLLDIKQICSRPRSRCPRNRLQSRRTAPISTKEATKRGDHRPSSDAASASSSSPRMIIRFIIL